MVAARWELSINEHGSLNAKKVGVAIFRETELLFIASPYDYRDRNYNSKISWWERSSSPKGLSKSIFVADFVRQLKHEAIANPGGNAEEFWILHNKRINSMLASAFIHGVFSAAGFVAKKLALDAVVSTFGGPVLRALYKSMGVSSIAPQWIFTAVGKEIISEALGAAVDVLFDSEDARHSAAPAVRPFPLEDRQLSLPSFARLTTDADANDVVTASGWAFGVDRTFPIELSNSLTVAGRGRERSLA